MEARSPSRKAQGGPEIVVRGPDGAVYQSFSLTGERTTVGRLEELNDIALAPDAEQFVSRSTHCTFERDGAQWAIVDGGSVNGTFVRRGATLERVKGRTVLRDSDVVCVLASVDGAGERRFFELAFHQPGDTQATRAAPLRTPGSSSVPNDCLSYDPHVARLVLVQGDARHEIRVRPQGHRLVRYMADRNAGGPAALCTHDELMKAIWDDEPMHTRIELARLVWELRRELRAFGAEHLLESERRRGYRLRTCAGP